MFGKIAKQEDMVISVQGVVINDESLIFVKENEIYHLSRKTKRGPDSVSSDGCQGQDWAKNCCRKTIRWAGPKVGSNCKKGPQIKIVTKKYEIVSQLTNDKITSYLNS